MATEASCQEICGLEGLSRFHPADVKIRGAATDFGFFYLSASENNDSLSATRFSIREARSEASEDDLFLRATQSLPTLNPGQLPQGLCTSCSLP